MLLLSVFPLLHGPSPALTPSAASPALFSPSLAVSTASSPSLFLPLLSLLFHLLLLLTLFPALPPLILLLLLHSSLAPPLPSPSLSLSFYSLLLVAFSHVINEAVKRRGRRKIATAPASTSLTQSPLPSFL